MLVFDIETDGLLDELTKVHCIAIIDTATDKVYRANHNGGMPVEEAVRLLEDADEIVGHNVIGFDVPAIQKVYPWFKPKGKVLDTLVWSRVIWPNVADLDHSRVRRRLYPPEFTKQRLLGKYKLAAWGYRLGEYKGDYTGPWDSWSQEMDDYCLQDVVVTRKLIDLILSKSYSAECLEIERRVAHVLQRQEARGFAFDVDAALALTKTLMEERAEAEEKAREAFAPWYVSRGQLTPKRNNGPRGYTQGCPLTKVELQVFNPGSRDQIADRLKTLYDWKPTEFTNSGKPKIDETILSGLPYPEAKVINSYFTVNKRLGQLAEGDNAWLKMVKDDGRIHGAVNTNGAVTGRMSHFNPNVAQVPRVGNPYGLECRSLFSAGGGYVLVGCDAEGIELRALAHYMAKWDGGEYAHAVVSGKKEDESDAHSMNRKALGLRSRDNAKTWFYAFIYGAGNVKLGRIVVDDMTEEEQEKWYAKHPAGEAREKAYATIGKRARDRLAKGVPALGKFIEAVKKKAKEQGYLKGLDGRRLHIRSQHSAPNTLLQSAGAVIMKKALLFLDDELIASGLEPGDDYEFVANVHDEWQIETKAEHAELVGKVASRSIERAGEYFGFRCPLAGDYAVGKTWADTH